MTDKLLPCPFCASSDVHLRRHLPAQMSWVSCRDCGLEAPSETGTTDEDAVAYWNRRSPPPETKMTGWKPMDSAPTDGTIINVVGRYKDATAGFPRYAGYRDGEWLEYSRFDPQPLVCWAWQPREDWPQEGDLITPPAPQEPKLEGE